MKSLSIILPTYNERENIKILIPSIVDYLKKDKIDYEIIVVDDNSPDKTAEQVKEFSNKNKRIRLVLNKEKKGIGVALKKGLQESRKEILLSMDADCSLKSSEIKLLLKGIDEGFDMVLGSKYLSGSIYEKQKVLTRVRSLISEIGNKYLSIVSGIPIRDFSLNFRAMKRKVFETTNPTDQKNFFLVQQIIQAHKKGFKIKEVPISFLERKYGESKTKIWNQSFRFFIGGFTESFLR
ncbi:glycosyltransferase [archaeon]|nr:glycosyltransferase [archaeon]